MDFSLFWSDKIDVLAKTNSAPVLTNVLRKTRVVFADRDKTTIECDNLGIKLFLQNKISSVEEMVADIPGGGGQVEFVVREKKSVKAKKTTDTLPPLINFSQERDKVFEKSGLQRRFTFDGFAVSLSNQIAYAAAQRVVENIGHIYNPLFIYGGVGVGKTHLIQSIGNHILSTKENASVLYCTSEEFTNDLVDYIRIKDTAQFRKKYRKRDVLIIDDIQFIAGKNYIQEEFYHTFNAVIKRGGQVILSSDRAPDEIKKLEDRLRSRFSGGLTIDMQRPDFELRCAILLIKAKDRGIEIDIESVKVLAEKVTDARELEGSLFEVYAKTIALNKPITRDMVFEQLKKDVEKKTKKMSVHDVIHQVASFYELKPSHLKDKTRKEHIALARQVAMYILREYLHLKFEEIAFHLKRKDHTTIMHGVDKISTKMMKDDNFRGEVEKITRSL